MNENKSGMMKDFKTYRSTNLHTVRLLRVRRHVCGWASQSFDVSFFEQEKILNTSQGNGCSDPLDDRQGQESKGKPQDVEQGDDCERFRGGDGDARQRRTVWWDQKNRKRLSVNTKWNKDFEDVEKTHSNRSCFNSGWFYFSNKLFSLHGVKDCATGPLETLLWWLFVVV